MSTIMAKKTTTNETNSYKGKKQNKQIHMWKQKADLYSLSLSPCVCVCIKKTSKGSKVKVLY